MLRRFLSAAILLTVMVFSPVQASGALVNMNVTNAEVRDVLTALAGVGQVSIVADDSVTGRITIQLRDIPFETALELVTKTKGLVTQKVGNVIVVADGSKMGRSFGTIQIIKIKYAPAQDIIQTLSLLFDQEAGPAAASQASSVAGGSPTQSAPSSPAKNRIKFDKATNSIIFQGTPAEAEQVQKILAELDIPYQQVSLEAEVVALNNEAKKDLGIDWKWEMTPTYPQVTPEQKTYIRNQEGEIVGADITTPKTVTRDPRMGVLQFGRNPEGVPYEFYYQAKISALVANGKAKVLAKPKITAINGKEARILIGDRIPVLTEKNENGKISTTTGYVEAGIKLTYTPQVNDDGQITAKVHTEVSSPTLVAEMKAYRITTREAETQVRMKDGETMVIGGLIGREESTTKARVPFLSDFPLLGKLFQSTHDVKNETEVVIFLTAKIIK